jgi:hypothetical protein
MSTTRRNDQMRILVVSTPGIGHLNPLLAIGRILIAEGLRTCRFDGHLPA